MEKSDERKILLRRLFWRDSDFYKIGKLAGIGWFKKFEPKFERDRYAYFSPEEKIEAMEKLTSISELPDTKLLEVVMQVYGEERRYHDIDRFVGQYYYFDPSAGLSLKNRQDEVRKDIRSALDESKGRAYYFLKAIIELHKEKRWDNAYEGAAWPDILAKIRELSGEYPPPRDLTILKSYKIYYKTGSRRYPTHTLPLEIMPVIEGVLNCVK